MERQFCAALSVDPARKFAGSGRLRGLLVAAIIERRVRAALRRGPCRPVRDYVRIYRVPRKRMKPRHLADENWPL
jgi:hypothetical protein